MKLIIYSYQISRSMIFNISLKDLIFTLKTLSNLKWVNHYAKCWDIQFNNVHGFYSSYTLQIIPKSWKKVALVLRNYFLLLFDVYFSNRISAKNLTPNLRSRQWVKAPKIFQENIIPENFLSKSSVR